jgi:hypothetical protein
MLSDLLAHLILKKIGAREPRQGEIKFLAPKIYLLINTHTLTQNSILKFTLRFNVHTHAQGYSRSLRSQMMSWAYPHWSRRLGGLKESENIHGGPTFIESCF